LQTIRLSQTYPETLLITDAAINIFPDLEAALPIVSHHLLFAVQICSLRRLDLQCLLFEACTESFNFLLLLRDGRFQLLHLAVLFEELVKQHRVHRLNDNRNGGLRQCALLGTALSFTASGNPS
jgi:hypothetical protein